MFIGRKKELLLLNQAFMLSSNALVVVYGREGIGKTSLVKKFVQDKEYVYYQARDFSEEEQGQYLNKKKEELLEKAAKGRVCFVIDEFDLMQRAHKSSLMNLENFWILYPRARCLSFLSVLRFSG